jgi:hypothetical protein
VPALSAEEQVEQSFHRFKKRLHHASVKWVELKTGVPSKGNSVYDIVNAAAAPAASTLVSLPSKSLAADRDLSHDQREELQRLARTIREEESARMQYEDQRRRLLLEQRGGSSHHAAQQGIGGGNGNGGTFTPFANSSSSSNHNNFSSNASVASGNSSHRLNKRLANEHVGFAGAAGVQSLNNQQLGSHSNRDATAGAGHYSTDYFFDTPINLGMKGTKGGIIHVASGKKPTQPEVDAAFKWLCIPRPLIIAERTPKEYVFAVVAAADENSHGESKNNSKAGKSFVFEWREGALRGGSVPDVLAGCVFISDVKEITGPSAEMDTFTLVIGSSTKALKNSKGRTTVVVKCTSPGECAKYLASLRCIRRSYED